MRPYKALVIVVILLRLDQKLQLQKGESLKNLLSDVVAPDEWASLFQVQILVSGKTVKPRQEMF